MYANSKIKCFAYRFWFSQAFCHTKMPLATFGFPTRNAPDCVWKHPPQVHGDPFKMGLVRSSSQRVLANLLAGGKGMARSLPVFVAVWTSRLSCSTLMPVTFWNILLSLYFLCLEKIKMANHIENFRKHQGLDLFDAERSLAIKSNMFGGKCWSNDSELLK